MQAVLATAAMGLQIAGSLSPVPYVALAGSLLQGISDACQQVAVHKRRKEELIKQCTIIVGALQENDKPELAGTSIIEKADELNAVLSSVRGRLQSWSTYSYAKQFLKRGEIMQVLDSCILEVTTALDKFNVDSHLQLHIAHRETIDELRMNSLEIRECKELLLGIFGSRQEMKNVLQYHQAGQPVASDLMGAGQELLSVLRNNASQDHETMISDRQYLTTSPSPPTSPVDSIAADEDMLRQCERGLYELHRLTGIPPTVKILNNQVTKSGTMAYTGGIYSEVWEGYWLGSQKVALKCVRNIKTSNDRTNKAYKRIEREIKIWADLHHDNVLPFYGITTDLGALHLVSPWQVNGNVLEYVDQNPDANRVKLSTGVAKGLEYLHEKSIVHGNIRCTNVLVSSEGTACICDFGVTKIIEENTDHTASATLTSAGSTRWLAPELIEGSSPTKACDIYSFGMTVLELLTQKPPFANLRRDETVVRHLIERKTPLRPEDPAVARWLTDDLWALMLDCWVSQPEIRPLMSIVTRRMEDIVAAMEVPTGGSQI